MFAANAHKQQQLISQRQARKLRQQSIAQITGPSLYSRTALRLRRIRSRQMHAIIGMKSTHVAHEFERIA